jgi:integrase
MRRASYLWRRGSRWCFQIRIPTELHAILGRSPLRIPLPPVRASEARRIARHLAGNAEGEFRRMSTLENLRGHSDDYEDALAAAPGVEHQIEQDFRNIRARICSDLVRRLDYLLQGNPDSIGALTDSGVRETQLVAGKLRAAAESWRDFSKELIEKQAEDRIEILKLQETLQAANSYEGLLYGEVDDLQKLIENFRNDTEGLEAALKKTLKRMLKQREGHERKVKSLHTNTEALTAQQIRINAKVFKEYPTLVQAGRKYLRLKRIGLGIGNKEYKYLKHRFCAFVRIVGNKRIDEYTLDDLTKFAQDLRFVPANYSVKPRWRNLKINKIIEANKSTKMSEAGLTSKTINTNYVGKIKTMFGYICAAAGIANPFENSRAILPKIDSQSVIRKPLKAESIAKLFVGVTQVTTKRPFLRSDDVFLPVLGALTGARLGELVFLQPSDIRPSEDHYIADLIRPIVTEDGEIRRPTKNDHTSLRYIVLHDELVKIGFVKWAHTQDKWVFPNLHHNSIKRPADTASKRFNRIFREQEIYAKRAEVFHSLRHFYKDWVRDCDVEERTIDLQTGHALLTVGRQYGSRVLRPKEIARLASLPLPEELEAGLRSYKGLDFSKLDRHVQGRGRPRISRRQFP